MSEDLTSHAQDILVRIYIGQNVRSEGILQSEMLFPEATKELLSKGYIRENRWYGCQYLTTQIGSILSSKKVTERIQRDYTKILDNYKVIPKRVLSFFVKRYVSKGLNFSTIKGDFDQNVFFSGSWEDAVLVDGRIWMFWNGFFEPLVAYGLCVKTHNYVSTKGGKLSSLEYVISSEVQNWLVREFKDLDFSLEEEKTLRLYPFLTKIKRILLIKDLNEARVQFYKMLRNYELTEDQVAAIIGEMSKDKITTEYRSLLSKFEPYVILDSISYDNYLFRNIIDPATESILKNQNPVKIFTITKKYPTLSEVETELGYLDDNQLGEFYLVVSSFERQLREFIKSKLGNNYETIIEKELPEVAKHWKRIKEKDEYWSIDPEKDKLSYCDLGDYIEIMSKFSSAFNTDKNELGDVITHIKMWYNNGRNPVMHSRTIDSQRKLITEYAIKFLIAWMSRKRPIA
jgi:hypothetical protein